MAANTLSGGKTLQFSVGTETFGYVQTYKVDSNTDRATAKGPDGHVMALQESNDTKSLSLNYIEFATKTGMPAVGTVFTFDNGEGADITWYIDTISYGFSVDGYKTVDVSASHFPNLGTPDS